jgi:DNA-directed RNA polymerase subunit RPC12/RpoP
MLLQIFQITQEHSRPSKNGKLHSYVRSHNVALLKCDCCGREFERRVSQMDPRRLTNEHVHVCPSCPSKRFAQTKGIESRRFWNTTVDLDQGLDSL